MVGCKEPEAPFEQHDAHLIEGLRPRNRAQHPHAGQIMLPLRLGFVLLIIITSLATSNALADGDRLSPNHVLQSTTPVPVSKHYVLFLAGVNSSSTDEEPLNGDFSDIQDHLADQLNMDRFVYFSYSAARHYQEDGLYCLGWGSGGGLITGGCETYIGTGPVEPADNLAVLSAWPEYDESDTHLSLHLQAEALDWLLGQIVSHDENAQIHLVGYSLGGILASHWAAHHGQSETWKQHVSSIVIIESPVGGIPLAGPFLESCGINPICRAWQLALEGLYGETVLSQLQLPEDAEGSIVGSLPEAARAYPFTSIQSTSDYTVNGVELLLCDMGCLRTESIVVGYGSQRWAPASHTLHFDQELGGDGLATAPLINAVALLLLRENHSAPLTYPLTARWVGEAIERAGGIGLEALDSVVTEASDFLALEPGEASRIVFEIQNTGSVSWLPGQGYALINTNEESLGASPTQALDSEIPPGRIALWIIPITAPSQISLNWTEWQMAHDGEPFGDTAFCLIAVVPDGDIDIDLAALLASWLDALVREIEDRFNQFLQDLVDRFEEWLQRESERLLSELLETLSQQCCGAALVAPGAILLVGWTSARRRRKGMGDSDRE